MRESAYKKYMLGLLVVLLAFNFMDRFALGVALEDIKAELGLTDTELGFLSGIAFAFFYAVMGIPIARWADRGNRVTIISLTAALWGVAVSLCGTAGSFVQLLLLRSAVAVGEAGGYLPGFSLLADYFRRAERPRAIAIYGLGGPISLIAGYSLAGWLNDLYGWRVMFILLGAPALILAALARFTLKEPRSQNSTLQASSIARSEVKGSFVEQPSLKVVCVTLFAVPTFRHVLLCVSVTYFFMYGILQWQPTFFIRSHGLSSSQVGTWFAVTYGMGGLLGTYFGGAWASRCAAQNERLQLKVAMIALACSAVLSTGIYLSTSPYVALGLMGPVMFAMAVTTGPLFATIQTLVSERMRAMAVAIVLLFANLIGMGMGPLAVGALSDALRGWAGEESLRYALLILAPGYFWAGWHAWRASKHVARDIAAEPAERANALDNPLVLRSST